MKGSVSKRCGCTEVVDGKRRQLGSSCPKLKRADGAWNPRHGTWSFVVTVPGIGGKRGRVVRGGFATSTEAQDALDKVKVKASKGIIVTRRLTVGDYLRGWISGKTDLKRKTEVSYTGHIDRYWEPYCGHLWLDDLRVWHVAAVFEAVAERNEQIAAGRLCKDPAFKGKRVVGPASMQRIRATLRSALTDAQREGLITVNVAGLVKLPSGKRPKALVWTAEREARWRAEVERHKHDGHTYGVARDLADTPSPVMVWRPDHLGTFLDYVERHRLYALWYLLSHRGPRRGETCGFEWHDLDEAHGGITVERQLISVDGQVIEDTPKSDAGGRVIPLGKDGLAVIRAHRKRQLAERLAWGAAWVDSGKVFTREDGSALDPDWVSDEFDRLCTALDLPPIRLHDLRHGAASLMLAAGIDMKIVQEVLGHANLATTANTYTSVYPDVATAAVEAASALVPRTRRASA